MTFRHASIRPGRPLRAVILRTEGTHFPAPEPAEAQPSPADLAAIGEATNELLQAVREAVADLENRRRQSLAEIQEFAIEVSMAAAARIVRAAIDRDAFGVESLVQELTGQLNASSPVEVLLHPDDLARIRALSPSEPSASPEQIRFVGDRSLSRRACRVTAESRTLISDWRTHLQDIRAVLHEELEHAQVERRGPENADQRVKRFPDRRETA